MINGKRPLLWFEPYDELDELKRRFTPEQLKEMWDACMPKLDLKLKGTVFLTGTGGNIENNGDLEQLFFKPKSYNNDL